MASSYLSPGVYMEEVSSGSKPIEAVGTAVAAFVGFAEKGPVNEPVLVTNWTQFTQNFGDFIAGSYLAHSVYGYFLNGGGAATWCASAGTAGTTARRCPRRELPAAADESQAAFTVRALPPANGRGHGNLTVEVLTVRRDQPDDTFKLVVKRDGTRRRRSTTSPPGAGRTTSPPRYASAPSSSPSRRAPRGSDLAAPQGYQVALAARAVAGGRGRRRRLRRRLRRPHRIRRPGGGRRGHHAGRTGPDGRATARGLLDDEGVTAVQLAMIAHCELMGDRVAILDTPPSLKAPAGQGVARRRPATTRSTRRCTGRGSR